MKVLFVVLAVACVHGMESKLRQEDVVFPEPCWNEKSKIQTYTVNGAPVFHSDSFVPKCDDNGMYSPTQCHGEECWCVTVCGSEVPNTRTTSWPTCSEEHTPPCTEMSRTREDVQCDKQGYFKHKQCDGEECFCVNKCGTEIEGTRTNENPRCKALFYRNTENEEEQIDDITRLSSTCADNSHPDVCDSSVCDSMTCPGFENARCKPNRCKGCVVEFYNDNGVKVHCNDAKIGVCPTTDYVKFLIGNKCTTKCDSDRDCNGALKCCSSGCGTECVPPKMDKHGSCPLPITIEDETCTEKCNIDNDCSRDEKCCSNGCGKVCVTAKPREKSGTCPSRTTLQFSTCDTECSTDNDCKGTQKCCQTVCGTMCTAPETKDTPNRPRNSEEVCPAVPRGTMGSCVNRCGEDSECEMGEKCCSNGCGTRCMKTVKKATPPCWAEKENTPTTMFGGISMPVLGTHYPTCDSEGFHTPKQCDTSSGICWCVDSCGMPINRTHTTGSLNCEAKETPCHDRRRDLMTLAPLLGRFRVQCMNDGYFESRQCHGSTCWCTDKCGNEIIGTRGHLTQISCECTNGERAWKCAKNPCDGVTCSAFPDAVCKPNMCGGCKAEFWRDDEKVNCEMIKNGRCPMTTDMPTSCSSDCTTDTDCPGTRKCCNNGCASICVSPVPEEKHGSCPTISLDTIGVCSTECTSDNDCHDNHKCCFNGCGRTCMMPTIKTNTGTCPVPWQMCSEDEKIDECWVDGECGSLRKCCESGCGKRCTSSRGVTTTTSSKKTSYHTTFELLSKTGGSEGADLVTVKYGTCPSPSIFKCEYINECNMDSDCTENKKCCSNGCGKVCSSPQTMAKYGQCPRNVITSETCTADTIFHHECEVDDQCSGTKKCCMRGCSRVCMDVWENVKVGQCPAMTAEEYDTCKTDRDCYIDSDCSRNKKCCNTPCGGTTCKNPTTTSTETCVHNGMTRVHGDVWQPDTCTTCKCWNGQTKCTPMTCPRLEYDCVAHPVEGQCCPTHTCVKTSFEFLKCEEGDGTKHAHADTWYPDECTQCLCEDGDIWCSRSTCTSDMSLTDKPGCRLVEVPGRCCPEVVCEDRCVDHEGHYRFENDIWYTDPCTKCSCHSNRVMCVNERHMCQAITHTDECQLEEVKGQCCPNVNCPEDSSDGSLCWDEGKTYGHGSKWQKNSEMCECRDGRVSCRDMSENCQDYNEDIRRRCTRMNIPGAICPELVCNDEPTCSHNGETHHSGETWHPDTCTTCSCDQGKINCLVINCPQPGPGCTARFTDGQCCAEITCPTYHHVPLCNSTGVWRTDSETWLENDCDVCTCHNGLTTCTPIECPNVTPTPGCHIIYEDGQCCPVKVCRGSGDTCIHEGKQYMDGESFNIDTPDVNINDLYTSRTKMVSTGCSTCTCVKGRISCMVNVCPQARPDCRVTENDVADRCSCPTIVCPEKKLGFCPIPDINFVSTCDSECDADTDCTSDTKCCFNGCGMSCTKPVIEGCFDSQGVKRENGDIWHKDNCVECKCVNDQSICSETKCPEVPSHCTVKPVVGQCCGELICQPTYPLTTCTYNNVIYTESSTWVVDNCNKCKCVNGEAVCDKQGCPTTNVPGCRPVYVAGKCCPEKVCREPNSCEVNNKIYLNGESWYLNQCNMCHCVNGEHFCTEMKCPEVKRGCRMEEPEADQCCGEVKCEESSSTENCEVDGVTKTENEVWMKDPCTACTCKEGKTICATTTCAKMSLRPGCRAVPVTGQCCPEIVCHDVQSCIVDGVEHRNGEQWLHDECTMCRCEHGNKYCTTKTCTEPPVNCDYAATREPGKCCPNIICPESQYNEVCTDEVKHRMKTFNHGETWMRNCCTQCTCTHGVSTCNTQSCPMTVSPGCRTVLTEGQCCPNIVCDPVKTGQCPIVNPFMPQTVTKDTCSSDMDCPGKTKCCSNGVARACMASWTTEKPGVCPRTDALNFPLRSTCMTECTTDTDCVSEWKCCSDGGCSMICRPPVATATDDTMETKMVAQHGETKTTSMLIGSTKSGDCPNIAPYGWNFQVCISHCNVDIDCPGDNKCCSNGCGSQCMPPMNPTKFGMCPMNQPRQRCDSTVHSSCMEDSDCMGNKKCCNTGCGLQCVVPDVDTTICPSLPTTCTKICTEGYATNRDGCEICKCKKPESRCNEVTCDMFCQYGWATDSNGCNICLCKKPMMPTMNMMSPMMSSVFCKPITRETCRVSCTYGYATDSVGCEVCSCRKPKTGCTPLTTCAQYCPYGYATNMDGCDMCMCKQPTISFVSMGMCTPLTDETCDKTVSCPHGFATNEQGCEICKCKNPVTESGLLELCDKMCPFGYATNDDGSTICKCKMPSTCSPIDTRSCDKDCPFGLATDMFGCEVCTCKQPEGSCVTNMENCPVKDMCAFGLATDAEGCEICKCKMPRTCTPVTPMTCKLNCIFGMASDESGCEICKCKKPVTECNPVTNEMCGKMCPFGLATDSQGCDKCMCKQPNMVMNMSPMDKALSVSNTPMCKPVTCEMACRDGFATDMLGCEICACKKSNSECTVKMDKTKCPMMDQCPYGLSTDMEGCEICQCKQPVMCPNPVTPMTCSETCFYGYATDSNGCAKCMCKKPILECPPMTTNKCAKTCTYGYASDSQGCEICMCKQPIAVPVTVTTNAYCPPVVCRMRCVNGWASDAQGCEICRCKDPVGTCPVIRDEICPDKKFCPSGLATNSDGCEICKCKQPVTCHAIDRSVCDKDCPHGFATSENGCETCMCKKIPSLDSARSKNGMVCPQVDSDTFGICMSECVTDGECADNKMCCSNGCGRMCTEPVRPESICTPVTKNDCKLNCNWGLATDFRGCEVCKCKSMPFQAYHAIKMNIRAVCKPMTEETCSRTCTHGFATDNTGCEKCECRTLDVSCPTVNENMCPLMKTSPFGLATNADGCDVCAPRNPIMCTPNTCNKMCARGFATDNRGCEICECKKSAQYCVSVTFRTCPVMAVCPNGLATNENGCEICKCKMPQATTVMEANTDMTFTETTDTKMVPTDVICKAVNLLSCHKNCLHGYATDVQGCDICMCKKDKNECPRLDENSCPLMKMCAFGMITDNEGCEICGCKQPAMCTPLNKHICDIDCEFGLATNEQGCEVCTCKTSPIECTPINPVTCKRTCPFGLATDLRGCEICLCKQPTLITSANFTNTLYDTETRTMSTVMPTRWIPSITCTPLNTMICPKTCNYGYMTNNMGCDICDCRKSSTECPTLTDRVCPLKRHCEYGMMTNTDGCEICRCKQPSLCESKPMNQCKERKACITGYATDENGCEICECKKPGNECPSFTCDKNCMLGYATDADRCETCMCKLPKTNPPFMDALELRDTYTTPKILPTRNTMVHPLLHVFNKPCSPVNPATCNKNCPHGYATCASCCEICKCRKPASECPEVKVEECPMKETCPYGLSTNSEGCDVCQCRKPITCPPVNAYTCPKVCPHGYATNNRGCAICQCLNTGPSCPTVNPHTCPKTCMEGYATDSEGCQVCKCRQPSSKIGISLKTFMPEMETCETVDCDLNCPNGYATDSTGCHVCTCRKREYDCPMAPMCSENCPLGFETAVDGCPSCTCKTPKQCRAMTPMTCDRNCPMGYATDIQGCDICKCKKPKRQCGTRMRDMSCTLTTECPFGLATDNDGCEICQCKMPSFNSNNMMMMMSPTTTNNKRMTSCMPVTRETCSRMCRNGYATDVNGCDVCKCKRPESECARMRESTCQMKRSCPYGLATDESGCEICQCKMPLTCPNKRCDSICEEGYATDVNGCETCQCKRTTNDERCDEINSQNCDLTCPLGLATDNMQCEICKCKNPSVTSMNVLRQVMEKMSPKNEMPFFSMALMSQLTTTTTATDVMPMNNQCPPVRCKLYCKHGFAEDPKTGCDTCMCKDAPKLGCPAVSYGTVGMCVDFCGTDTDCPHDSLCCSNGCGKTCVKAMSTECVDEHGLTHSEGDLWHRDSCTRCSCLHGKIKCTSMECQPVPEGCMPVYQTGQCCPTFQCTESTCDREGEMWMDDVCTNCTCKEGVTHCMSQSCPKVKPGCVPVYKDGKCCPEMKCTGCISETNRHYEHGQTWNDDMCTTCKCQNGESICTSMTCDAPKPGCTVIPKEGQCCPTVVCSKGEEKPCISAWRSVPTMLLQGRPVPAPGAFVPVCDLNGFFNATQCHITGYCWCVDRFGVEKTGTRTRYGMPECEIETCMDTKGNMYNEGDQWRNSKCETCTCVNGVADCRAKTCPSVPENCRPVETDNHCCPQYVCNDHCIDVKANRHQVFDRWNLDSCTQCTCYDANIICRSQDCPTETEEIPEGCQMVPQDGECCPSKLICNDDCPIDQPIVTCVKNPCDDAYCGSNPDASCRANYCGSCKAEFYDEHNNKVTCQTTEACRSDVIKTTNDGTEMTPRCTPDGYYSPKQCDNTGACWCVDRTGEMVEDTHNFMGEDVVCEEEPPCYKEMRDIQDKLNHNIRVESDPSCDNQGWYVPRQCNPSTNECWCSEKDGTEILGSRKSIDQDLNCNMPCFGEKHDDRCSLTNRCSGDKFCHYLPNKDEGYCCKRPKN